MTEIEFPRQYRLDEIGSAERAITISASADECAALAQRFDLRAVTRLEAEATLSREGAIVTARGRLIADVVQSCIATGDPVPASLTEPFLIRFTPESMTGEAEEIELSNEDCDSVFYAGGAIDMGEAVAESLALALDPFPRSPNADTALRAAGVIGEDEAGPFGALRELRDKLSGGKP